MRAFFFVLFLVSLFLSCAVEGEISPLGCWVSMEETGAETVKVRVRLEDLSGNVPTGARVLLETPAAAVSWMYYDSESNLYETTLSSPVSGDYGVSVRSALGDVETAVPFVSLSAAPTVQTLQDAAGTVAGGGDPLDSAGTILAAWEAVEGATAYQGTVVNGVTTVLVFSTTSASYVFPAGTFEAGKTYALTIEAQYISGDPYLRESDYYVFSYSESPDYYYTTE